MFDTHAHYNDRRFDVDRDELLRRLFFKKISGIVEIGTNRQDSAEAMKLASKYKNMYFAPGLYPQYAEDIDNLEEWLLPLLYSEKCVAIGEIGLDYHYEAPSKEIQKAAFEKQLRIAGEHNMPVIIHDRDAHGDCLEIIKRYPGVKGLFHSFSGSAEMAKILVKMGWYISFSGVVTFKNAPKTVEAASVVPLDRLLIETDCPYMAPHPHRGERNDSSLMEFTLSKLSEIKGVEFSELERITTENAKRFYGIA